MAKAKAAMLMIAFIICMMSRLTSYENYDESPHVPILRNWKAEDKPKG
jgi:hypothetical protein